MYSVYTHRIRANLIICGKQIFEFPDNANYRPRGASADAPPPPPRFLFIFFQDDFSSPPAVFSGCMHIPQTHLDKGLVRNGCHG